MTILAELGDLKRFARPKGLMALAATIQCVITTLPVIKYPRGGNEFGWNYW
jgi:hypothetical protein